MENTLIIINTMDKAPTNGLTEQQNKMLSMAGTLDIITEACRLAECNPEMKVVFYDYAENSDAFWQKFNADLQTCGLATDKHLSKFFSRKVIYERITQQDYTKLIISALQKEETDEETENIVLINGSCPMIIGEILDDAFYYLGECDVVLGGAKKSDLYLLGVHQIPDCLLTDFCWESGSSCNDTADLIKNAGLYPITLDVLDNIYNYQSLEKLYEKIKQNGFAPNTKNILQKIFAEMQ